MSTDDGTTDDQRPVIVELVPGHLGGGEFTLRVTPAYEPELAELLRENDLYGGELLELSDPVTVLAVISVAVSAGGALTKLADVLEAFFARNEGKEFTLRSHASEVKAKGFSRRDAERLIETTAKLQSQWDQQSLEQRAQGAADDEARSELTEKPDDRGGVL
jgi:hypothetical protein